ncbi:sensor histidine kinase [Mucilaginibacter limnophilus]|uniref:sensor histidine kinase n=1 Tax=Mucilaginibacter limnophilus TaxID=1932778 RepID=UPI0013E3DA71|nr:ATP-binding protein [Mucilaginibacter limnophilus]
MKLEGDLSAFLYADQQKIEQVLVNLVNNAVKYAPKSLFITFRVEQLPSAVKITVSDEGPGIALEHLSHLFDRYFRADQQKSQTSGLGLGLYISSEIIRRHGGRMGVDTSPGEGASFWFTLPNPDR